MLDTRHPMAALCATLLACGTRGAGPPERAAPAAPDLVRIHTRQEAEAAVGKQVHLEGKASDAKISGVVVTSDLVVYCLDVPSWEPSVEGTTVAVEGRLERTAAFQATSSEGGVMSSGTGGPVLVIRACARKPGGPVPSRDR
jgi:hypothetical protein